MRPINTEEEDPQSRVLYQLSSMIIQLLRFPSPSPPLSLSPSSSSSSSSSSSIRRRNNENYNYNLFPRQISPIAFASLFLGISFALMLFGSVTFLIGFMLLPWVIALVLIFYFAGLVSSLSDFGSSFLCWAVSPPHHHHHHASFVTPPAWKCS